MGISKNKPFVAARQAAAGALGAYAPAASEKIQVNTVHYKDSQNMGDLPDSSVDLIVTSPPYFNIKDYAKDGRQKHAHSAPQRGQIGDIADYDRYIAALEKVWRECERTLKPNGKLAINVPLLPMRKAAFSTHYNRHLFDLHADIQHSILRRPGSALFLYDVFIWNRTNASKPLMFGSYPYPRNFYAQNTSEFVGVYVKDGKPAPVSKKAREKSQLNDEEWREYTAQIWNIPAPGRGDSAYGEHSAIMPEEIARRCIRLFSFVGDIVLDPFAGSGTTLKAAAELERRYIGYEIVRAYEGVINKKIRRAAAPLFKKN